MSSSRTSDMGEMPLSSVTTFQRWIQGRVPDSIRKLIRFLAQTLIIVAVYCIGSLIASISPISLPGSIVGMVLFLILLLTGILKLRHVEGACRFLIDYMSIFFIPAAVAIMGCFSMLAENGLKFILICIVTTILTFAATSYTVIAVMRLLARRHGSTDSDEGEGE